MKTIQTKALVDPERRVTIQLPDDVEPGEHQLVVVYDERPVERTPGRLMDDFPTHDVGPWPEGLSLRREDLYGDDGR